MARDPESLASSLARALRSFRRPWPVLLAGLACTILGLVLTRTPLVPQRLMFLGAGLLLCGIAVAKRLQTASWELEDRVESSALLVASAFVAMLAWFNMEPSWDSGSAFLIALIAVALGGAFIVLLPQTGRRIAALVLVLLHFGGILTSVTAVPPRNEPAPWLSMQLWTNVYRHYLFFGYLTNAYHFYSPDPGPPTLLWFHVEYADGSARWIKIPSRNDSPIGLHHQRMLAAAESAYNPVMGAPLMTVEDIKQWEHLFKRKYELLPGIPYDPGEDIMRRRQAAAETVKFIDPQDGRPAPLMVLDELPPLLNQYSAPQEIARRLLSSFARHVAHTSPDPQDPSNPVQAVRIYRVIHTLISPRELSEGKDPLDLMTFIPYYMGKYDPEGRLLDPKDPFLFWHVPYARVPKRFPEQGTFFPSAEGMIMSTDWNRSVIAATGRRPDEPTKIIDFVEIHATQSDRFQPETEKK